jgi:TonB family protein
MLLFILLLLQAQGPYRVGQGVTPPSVISKVEPQFTEAARAARVQGTVVLEAVINEDGTPTVSRVVRGVGYGLDENAVRAIEQWRFQPGTKDGKPVKVALNVEVNFNLDRQPGPSAGGIPNGPPAAVTVVAADPNLPGTLYAATRLGIYKTTDGGASWRASGSLPNVAVLRVDPQNSSVLYASNPTGLFKSTDGGGNWNLLQQGSTRQILFDPRNPATLYLATQRAIRKSIDGGNSWIDLLPGSFSTLQQTSSSRMVAVTDSGELYGTSDGGTQWRFIGGGVNELERIAAAAIAVPAPARAQMITLSPGDPIVTSLIAPRLISPEDGAVLAVFPRQTTVRWAPSPNAASYLVEWDYGYNGVWHLEDQKMPDFGIPVQGTEFTFDFPGAQPGRWRVYPVNAAGQRGAPSEWRTFRYSK